MSGYAIAEAKIAKVNATMDIRIAEIRDRNASELAKLNEERDRNFELIKAYAIEQKERLFVKKKSLDTPHGAFGFRTGTPKLKTLKGFTWGAVTNLLREFLPAYVRVIEEPAKDKLLADRQLPEVAEMMGRVGVYVDQDEAFFIEVKREADND